MNLDWHCPTACALGIKATMLNEGLFVVLRSMNGNIDDDYTLEEAN